MRLLTADVVRLGPADHEEAIDFLNLVFGAETPHDFERQIPHAYRPSDMTSNVAIREDGRIRAIVGLFERDWMVGDYRLRVGGIGGVSTHPRARNRGFMRILMDSVLKDMQDRGFDVSWLGGQRQRYQRYGYERCGTSLRMHVDLDNVARALPGEPPLRLERVGPDDVERLDTIAALHDRQPLHHVRNRADLHALLTAWRCSPWVGVDPSGEVVGYLVARDDAAFVSELVGARPLEMVWARIGATGRAVDVALSPLDLPAIHAIGRVCGHSTVRATGNWRILRWERTLEALLALRATLGPPLPGAASIAIGDLGIRITSDGARFEVVRCATSEAELAVDELGAMALLFGPQRPSQVVPLPPSLAVLEQWCPLPLFQAAQDAV